MWEKKEEGEGEKERRREGRREGEGEQHKKKRKTLVRLLVCHVTWSVSSFLIFTQSTRRVRVHQT